MSNTLYLTRKAENGIAAFIVAQKVGGQPLNSYNVYEASQADDLLLPAIVVGCKQVDEAFAGGPKILALTVAQKTQLDDNGSDTPSDAERRAVRALHDDALAVIIAALDGPGALAALQAYLNKVNVTSRPVSAFYLYDITATDSSAVHDGRMFGDVLTFQLVADNQDN